MIIALDLSSEGEPFLGIANTGVLTVIARYVIAAGRVTVPPWRDG